MPKWKIKQKLVWWLLPGRVVLESSFQNSIPHTFAAMEFAPKEEGPNLGEALVGQILTKVMGFHQYQKYHTKGKQRGALVKGQARKLLWWLIPGRVVLESSVQNSIPQGFAGMEFAPKEQGPNLWGALVGQTLMKVRGFATNPGIQKYHIKGKRRGARKKGQARKLFWWPIPGCVVRKVLLRT